MTNQHLRERLGRVESPGITTVSDGWPIFWSHAHGSLVFDVEGREFIDLTAAFGVAALGHADAGIADAVDRQARRLLHGMGDVHPPALKVDLMERLTRFLGHGLTRVAFGLNGADAVETALKCAQLVTGKPGVIAFEGSYHGLYGAALEVTSRRDFRDPVAGRLSGRTAFAPYPVTPAEGVAVLAELRRRLGGRASGLLPTGAVIIEPIQARGGARTPPPGFLGALGALCAEYGVMLLVDEIFTGFGRTGHRLAIDHPDHAVTPDLLCVGKALGGGMPLSAVVGHESSLGAWPKARGEALHTATFLGHPGACAAALAFLDAFERQALDQLALARGHEAREQLEGLGHTVLGRGLMLGIALGAPGHGVRAMERCLELGVLTLVEGPEAEVLAVTPPLTIPPELLRLALSRVDRAVRETAP